MREGKVFTAKTEEFFKKRAEIEREYAKKLQALVKSTEVERGYDDRRVSFSFCSR